jgi:hypothetical protein
VGGLNHTTGSDRKDLRRVQCHYPYAVMLEGGSKFYKGSQLDSLLWDRAEEGPRCGVGKYWGGFYVSYWGGTLISEATGYGKLQFGGCKNYPGGECSHCIKVDMSS